MLLFDIDGTLLLTGGAGRIAFEQVFQEMFGIGNSWQKLIPDGKTDPMIIEELVEKNLKRSLTPQEYEKLCECYIASFEAELKIVNNFRLMLGVPELLTLIDPEKYLLGIATGNFEKAAWLKLEKAGLEQHFHFGGYGSDSHLRPLLTQTAIQRGYEKLGQKIPQESIYVIGDSVHDVRAGKALGVKTIAVGTGSTSEEMLRAQSPDYYFKDLAQTELFLEAIA